MLECSGQAEICGRGVDNLATINTARDCRDEPARHLAVAAIFIGTEIAPASERSGLPASYSLQSVLGND